MPTRSCLVPALVCLGVHSGCATTRVVLLQEFEPAAPEAGAPSLDGKRVALGEFTLASYDLAQKVDAEAAIEPAGYSYRKMSPEEEDRWDQELERLKGASSKAEWYTVGWMRNGFGMHMADVYSVNSPGEWLRRGLELEVQARKGTIVPADSPDPDLKVSMSVQYLKVDIYMRYWADLVLELQIEPRGKAPVRKVLHTRGSQTAWSGSSFEFYQPLRMAYQKAVLLAMEEIQNAL